ncbi:MAG: hypothetical protein NVS9B14_24000 [Candidatus Acidiferrum sp.]
MCVTVKRIRREGCVPKLGAGHEQWFVGEVEKGIEAADSGELAEHEEIRKLIDRR